MGSFSVDPNERWKTVPKGEYEVMIRSAEEKTPKKGEHNYIEVAMEIIAGEFKGDVVIDRLSLSPKAAPRLAGFIHACGLVDPTTKGAQTFDTADLVQKILVIKGEPETFQGFERFRPTSFKMHPDIARVAEGQMNQEAQAARDAKPAEPAKPASQAPASKAPVARRPI